ncbi:MAG TPA: hypothetical protein VLJ83_05365 [Gemmatimonadaceae bacterium]|nr:hypothetical protein [Gemmatimonadaceae bacterium]
MVTVSIQGDRLHLDVEGIDKFWSLRSHLEFPLSHIRSVRADPEPARGWWHGFRLGGTQVPGVLTAGSFYEHGGMVFYDVHDPDGTIVLELDHERYKRLIIEVEEPEKISAMISRQLDRGAS